MPQNWKLRHLRESALSMHDDEMMNRLLTRAMAAEVPTLSPEFDAAVMRRVRPRRLSRWGRMTMEAYAVAAAVATLWALRDLDPVVIAVGVSTSLAIAGGARVYVQAVGHARVTRSSYPRREFDDDNRLTPAEAAKVKQAKRKKR